MIGMCNQRMHCQPTFFAFYWAVIHLFQQWHQNCNEKSGSAVVYVNMVPECYREIAMIIARILLGIRVKLNEVKAFSHIMLSREADDNDEVPVKSKWRHQRRNSIDVQFPNFAAPASPSLIKRPLKIFKGQLPPYTKPVFGVHLPESISTSYVLDAPVPKHLSTEAELKQVTTASYSWPLRVSCFLIRKMNIC